MLNISNIEFSKNPVSTNEAFLAKVTLEETFLNWEDTHKKHWNELDTWQELNYNWEVINARVWSNFSSITWQNFNLKYF